MAVHINNEHPKIRISPLYLEKRILRALHRLGRPEGHLGITLVTDQEITRLNALFLKKQGPTDVLSFPMNSREILGDVVISLDTARQQALDEGIALKVRCLVLTLHGLLHLLGYDHIRQRDYRRMVRKERELLRMIDP